MKTLKEWQSETQQHENPTVLIEKLGEIALNLEHELKSFSGDRFDGFLELIGTVKELRNQLASLENGL